MHANDQGFAACVARIENPCQPETGLLDLTLRDIERLRLIGECDRRRVAGTACRRADRLGTGLGGAISLLRPVLRLPRRPRLGIRGADRGLEGLRNSRRIVAKRRWHLADKIP
jgi:hypothetical protein